MNWELLFQQWKTHLSLAWEAIDAGKPASPEISAAMNALETEARALLQQNRVPDVEWLSSALEGHAEEDKRKRHFIRVVLGRVTQIPPMLFKPLLHAAVYERDPSFNRGFIEPCLRWAGRRWVNEELLRYLESGTNIEKAGAASAFYWSIGLTEGIKEENINDLLAKKRCLFLTEFVTNEDVDVRRRIVPMLLVETKKYPEELHPLVLQAIEIARTHEDAYIRHRIEIQLGGAGPYMPIPT